MSDPRIHPIAASVKARDQDLAREFQKIAKRDWWVWGYSIFVVLLLAVAVIAFSLPAVPRPAETIFQLSIVQVVLGLVALVVFFNVYAVSQATVIKRLRR